MSRLAILGVERNLNAPVLLKFRKVFIFMRGKTSWTSFWLKPGKCKSCQRHAVYDFVGLSNQMRMNRFELVQLLKEDE